MNPEFRRNLILELSVQRLIAMPVILLLIFALVNLAGGRDSVAEWSRFVMIGILVVWGSRLAADSVLGEVAARTWDAQRMSSIGPFTMGWGKLFGSTIFVWYGVLWCAVAFLYGQGSIGQLARLALLGLFCHAIALFASLLFHRLRPQRMRLQVSLVQAIAMVAALVYWQFLSQTDSDIVWYGLKIPVGAFALATAAAYLAWAFAGVYRLMRTELQFRSWSLVWLGFVIFTAFYVGGFSTRSLRMVVDIDGIAAVERIVGVLLAFVVAVGLTWLAAFAEPKGFVRLRKWRAALASGRIPDMLEATPGWVLSLFLATLLGILLIGLWIASPDANAVLSALRDLDSLGAFTIAIMLFLVRDIGLIHFFTLDGRSRRGHLSSLVYLTVFYVIVPLIMATAGAADMLPVLVPMPVGNPLLIILPVLVQVGLVGGLLVWRWQRVARAMAAGA